MPSLLRRVLIGVPLPTHRAKHERLNKFIALPVFASDAISSCAYATEEILRALLLAGTVYFSYSIPVAGAIAVLLVIVTISYRQTVLAYPTGGGAYIVARENLGIGPATVAGAALLIDYLLTVSVSVAAGIAAIDSAVPALRPYRVALCLAAIIVIAVGNLRGVRESGMLFAFPTYLFIFSLSITLGIGAYRLMNHMAPAEFVRHVAESGGHPLTMFLLLRAFASGCAALTGVEAISNGVQAFKSPEGKNAATTMTWMSAILMTLFVGITYEVYAFRHFGANIVPTDAETIVSQLVRSCVGSGGFYFIVQAATAAILILAANTSFADFPRLGAILARDRFLPRQLANVGDRLVFNNGIILLSILSAGLIVMFKGNVDLLIPLYAVGVFLSFTLSQSGMVKRWWSLKTPGWRRSAIINGIGAVTTAVVLGIIAVEKFAEGDWLIHFRPAFLHGQEIGIRAGAWMVIVLIWALVRMFDKVHRHYMRLRGQLSLEGYALEPPRHNKVVLLTGAVNRGVIPALQFAQSISDDVQALYVELDPEETPRVRDKWEQWGQGVPLVVLESPYRSLVDPVLKYLDFMDDVRPDDHIVVVIPEFVTPSWGEKLLHNHSGLMLKFALLFRPNIIVANVRYWVNGSEPRSSASSPGAASLPLPGAAPAVPKGEQVGRGSSGGGG